MVSRKVHNEGKAVVSKMKHRYLGNSQGQIPGEQSRTSPRAAVGCVNYDQEHTKLLTEYKNISENAKYSK